MGRPNDLPDTASDGFEGEIAGLGLADIIQLNVQNRFSGCIDVHYEGSRGLIFLREGEILHAEQDSMVGEEAFYAILSWPGGRFSLQPNVVTTRSTIKKNWQHLILEAHRLLDERRSSRGETPPPLPPDAGGKPARANPLVERIGRIAGVALAVLQTRDGVRLGEDSYEREVLAGQAQYLALVGGQLGTAFQAGEIQSATVQGTHRHLLLFATKTHLLAVLVRGEVPVGPIDAEVKKVLAQSR
jgi:hypothetical protein